MKSRIVGTGAYLPGRLIENEELCRTLRLNAEEVFQRTGIRGRRWADHEQHTSHLAVMAARRACEAASVDVASIDAIIVSTTSPDMVFPSTACQVQRGLGAAGAVAFDVAASCSGFLYGVSMADRLLRCGQSRRCLVIAAEIKSRFLNHRDESTAILFGDGAGAALLQCDKGGPTSSEILGVRLYADGAGHGLIRIPAGGSRQPACLETVQGQLHGLSMQGGALFRVAVKRLAASVADLLKEFGIEVDDLQQAIFHQANDRLLQALARRLSLSPEQTYSTIERYGNTSSASLPIALDHAVREGRVRTGDLILLGAFGGGLTWAAGLVRW
jgi:3-oxoacyl-[acyl-carrier-protein] synthase-3